MFTYHHLQMFSRRFPRQLIGFRRFLSRGIVTKPFCGSIDSTAPCVEYEGGVPNSKNIPEYFNFTRDVIDKWAEVQRVNNVECEFNIM